MLPCWLSHMMLLLAASHHLNLVSKKRDAVWWHLVSDSKVKSAICYSVIPGIHCLITEFSRNLKQKVVFLSFFSQCCDIFWHLLLMCLSVDSRDWWHWICLLLQRIVVVLSCVFVALQFVAVWPHGCVRQPSRLRPRDLDCVQGQQPEPGGPTVHAAQLVPRVTQCPSSVCLSVRRSNIYMTLSSRVLIFVSSFVVRDTCVALCLRAPATVILFSYLF